MIRQLTFAAFAAAISCASFAQSAIHYKAGQHVDPHEVANILGAAPMAGMKTRSIRMLDAGDKTQNAATVAAATAPTELSLPVQFAFNSADIESAARPQLDALAAGIKLLPPEHAVMIEGHTDAVGTHEYNQRLSQRRAQAVKQYLVRMHGINAARLRTAGVGEVQPINGSDPFASANRRVQFRGG